MADVSICSYNTIFRFTANVQNLTSTVVESSEFTLSNLKWKVNISKRAAAGYIGVYLASQSECATDKWTCEAQAAFKLWRKDDHNDQPVVKFLSKRQFSNENPCHGIEEFMEWNEFLEHFVTNNKVTFEIEISTDPLMLTAMPVSDVDQRYVKFRVSIKNVSKKNSIHHTPEVLVGGIRWKIQYQKSSDVFSIYLCATDEDMAPNWSYKVNATISLLSYSSDGSPVKRQFQKVFRRELLPSWGYREFISWEKLMDTDKSYVLNDCVILEISIKVDEPKADWEIGRPSLSKGTSLLECCLCYDCFPSGEIFSTRCGHLFCQSCFTKSIENNPVCSMCKADTSLTELHPIYFK